MKVNVETIKKQNSLPVVISVAHIKSGMLATLNVGIVEKKVKVTDDYPSGKCWDCTQINICAESALSLADYAKVIIGTTGDVVPDELSEIINTIGGADRSHIISSIVRAKYSADDVEAIILNKDDGTEKHANDYAELQAWRTHAKEIAKSVLGE